jgi:hypothetical protein
MRAPAARAERASLQFRAILEVNVAVAFIPDPTVGMAEESALLKVS